MSFEDNVVGIRPPISMALDFFYLWALALGATSLILLDPGPHNLLWWVDVISTPHNNNLKVVL